MNVQHLSDTANTALNYASVGALVGTFLGFLPHIAALLSVVWFALKIAVAWQEYRLNKRKLAE